MDYGTIIRNLRKRRNVTQAYMAAQLQMSVTAYGNIERNGSKRLALPLLKRIAAELGVPGSALLGGEGKDRGSWPDVVRRLARVETLLTDIRRRLEEPA
ncbi:helix-turn-helix domain-containing protein [Chitinophaga lutea]